MVVTAIVGAGVVSAGAGIIGSESQAGAAENAANVQGQAAANANALSASQFNQTQQNIQPFVNAGSGALPELEGLLGTGGDPTSALTTLQNTPGYQFTNTQGLKATQNLMSARGLGQSGAALKGAATYATGLANNTWQNQVNSLQNLVNSGSSAAGGLGTIGASTAATQGNNLIGAGNAAAAAANAQSLPATAGASGVASAAGNVQQLYLLNGLLQSQGQPGLFGNSGEAA